jgi:chloramphenicol-sensitive protein RarD
VTPPRSQARTGMILGLTAYAVWGVLPLYFRALAEAAPTEIVAHRIVWSLVFLTAGATLAKRWSNIRAALATRHIPLILLATAAFIAVNWTVYIYAVASGHVLEGSLGYYLNPLVNVLLGTVFLKERLTRAQAGAVALAALAVAILAVGAGGALWISLTLAASFASYGFIRKVAPVDAFEGLYIETLFLAPIALVWIAWLTAHQQSHFLVERRTDLLLVLGGAVTALPLLLFTAAAKRLAYSTLGFLQYVAPTLQFLIAVAVFGEPLSAAHLFCFALIWTALAIFIFESVRVGRADAARLAPLAPAR